MTVVLVGLAAAAFTLPPVPETRTSRRGALIGGASLTAALFAPRDAAAVEDFFAGSSKPAVPTFSLKGVPGLSFRSDDEPPPVDLGVIGRGTNKDKTGRLNKCENGKKGCISTFDEPDADSYVPPWTYQPGYSNQAISANDARREALRAAAGLEANGGVASPPKPKKSREEAYEELKAVIVANNGVVTQEGDRYIRCEFAEGGVTDDVEFLLSLDAPIVGYRSAARKGGDDKRQRRRVRDLRKALQEQSGWKSLGRVVDNYIDVAR